MTDPDPSDRDWTRGAIVFGVIMKVAFFVGAIIGMLYILAHNGGSMR